jgi:hypothetical protein
MTLPFSSFTFHFLPNWFLILYPLLCLEAFAYQPLWDTVQLPDRNYLISVLVVEVLYRKLLCVRPTFFFPSLFCFIVHCSLSDMVFELGSCCGDHTPLLVGILIIIIIVVVVVVVVQFSVLLWGLASKDSYEFCHFNLCLCLNMCICC